MPIFPKNYLNKITFNTLKAAKVPENEAQIVADFLIESNLAGHDSHGIIRLTKYLALLKKEKAKPGTKIKIIKQTSSAAVIDGNWGLGQIVASQAMKIAVQKAEKTSIGIVTVRHCNHIGRLAHYATIATKQNMIAIIMVNGTSAYVAPYGGCESRLSTNPICIAIPTRKKPLILDMATSMVSEGKIRIRRNAKKNVPVEWLIDTNGKPITNPLHFYEPIHQSIMPLGGISGYKGFGLGFMFDILAGALSGAGCSNKGNKHIGNGIFMEAVKVENFIPLQEFYSRVEKFIKFIKSSKITPGFKEILVPGELEDRIIKERSKKGIFIDNITWREIKNRAKEFGVNI